MRDISIPRQWSDILLEGGTSFDDGVVLLASGPRKRGKLTIRRGTYVNRYTIFDVHESIEVGRKCLIGPFCFITDSDHIVTASLQPGEPAAMRSARIKIEDDVWLGAGVIVLKGVTIGRSAVVGAGAVVTKDVPAGTVVAGVPATRISTNA